MIKQEYYLGEHLRDQTGFWLKIHRKLPESEDFILENHSEMPPLERFEQLVDSFYTSKRFILRPFGDGDELVYSAKPKMSLLVYEKEPENLCLQISFSNVMRESQLACSVRENLWHLTHRK